MQILLKLFFIMFLFGTLLSAKETNMEHTEKPLVSFALIGDPQYADRNPAHGRNYRNGDRLLSDTVQRLNKEKLDFIVSLGDIGDGQSRNEIPLMLKHYNKAAAPVKHVVGNHDYVLYSETELLKLFGIKDLFYDFSVGNVLFIVLNGLDESRFSPPASERKKSAAAFRKAHPWLKVREWDGMLSQSSKKWLKQKLDESRKAGKIAVILCHIPLWKDATKGNARMWDHAELLEILDSYDHVRGWFAGHYHPGGIAIRNGVLHKTVRAICNSSVPTACIAKIYKDRIELKGIGEEKDFVFAFNIVPAKISGTAQAGSIVMTNTGELTEVGTDGKFSLTVQVPGIYSLKAIADGKADTFVPNVKAPASDIKITMKDDPGRRIVRGNCGGFATLKITDDGKPVRWFDLAGNPYGGIKRPKNIWNENCTSFWTRGAYAFSAKGKTEVSIEPHYPELRKRGWYKGDFHAHIIHYENTYRGNLPMFAFAARAEHYDWLWASSYFSNDGTVSDHKKIAEQLSDDKFLLRLNSEFPKNWRGHIGNIGVEPITVSTDTDNVTNFELVRRYITSRGGIAVPVHPLYDDVVREEKGRKISWMTGKEIFLWLLCDPEMMPCLDLLYHNFTPNAMEFWYMLLNRGYRIGCTATSDAAFDVGRTPGSNRGATFVKAQSLTESGIMQALRERRTVVTWDGAVVLLEIDGKTSGDILYPDGSKRQVVLTVYDRPGKNIELKLIRNGAVFRSFTGIVPNDSKMIFRLEITENENCWYLAELRESGKTELIRSAASPIYFRNKNFREPEVLPIPSKFSREFLDYMKFLTIEELTTPATFDKFRKFLTDIP